MERNERERNETKRNGKGFVTFTSFDDPWSSKFTFYFYLRELRGMAASGVSPSPAWASNLSVSSCGLYYDGILNQKQLEEVLELHKRDTVSTFGTRSSSRVSSEAKAIKRVGKLSKVVLEADKENCEEIQPPTKEQVCCLFCVCSTRHMHNILGRA